VNIFGTFGTGAWGIYSLFVLAISLGLLIVKVLALIDVTRRPKQSFPAVGRQTKQLWLIFTVGAVIGHLLDFRPTSLINLIGTIAAIVYMVDVRVRIKDLYDNRY
jgi:xanthine/uracil/vitamin C permease (AzgA family)